MSEITSQVSDLQSLPSDLRNPASDFRTPSSDLRPPSGSAQRLPPPVRLTEQVWPEGTVPVVSVFCITYNHVNFIRDAIEGFLMQETTFPVEIFIHDDASTDGTAEIVKEYAEKYPKLFWTVLQTENQWSKGNRNANFFGLMQEQRGEFIALCEGDDYWTDSTKLQQQVEFLEKNPNFVICGHNAFCSDKSGQILENLVLPMESQIDDPTGELFIKGDIWALTGTWLFRNVILEIPHEASQVLNGDGFLASLLGHFGGYKYMGSIKPNCYRVHEGGIWSLKSDIEKTTALVNSYYHTHLYYKRIKKTKYESHFFIKAKKTALPLFSDDEVVSEAWKRIYRKYNLRTLWWRIKGSKYMAILKTHTKS